MQRACAIVAVGCRGVASSQSSPATGVLLDQAAAAPGVHEAAVLSTCNRVEVYAVSLGDEAERAVDALRPLVAAHVGEASAGLVWWRRDDGAALHLFRVAAGLDSVVLGEAEVFGQVRAARAAALARGTGGPALDALFGRAVAAGRRARLLLGVSREPPSLGRAVADAIAGAHAGAVNVLVVGAGALATDVTTALDAREEFDPRITITNRSEWRAAQLAGAMRRRARVISGDAATLAAAVSAADVVVCATSAPGPVLGAADLARWTAARDRPVLVFDLGRPPAVDRAAATLPTVVLHDLDHLEDQSSAAVRVASERQLAAERFIAGAASGYRLSGIATSTACGPGVEARELITTLRASADRIREAELDRFRRRNAGLPAAVLEAVETLTAQLTSKLLHTPTVTLREPAANAVTLPDAARALFGIPS